MVDDSAWRAEYDLWSLAQLEPLLGVAHAADEARGAKTVGRNQGVGHLLALRRELTRGAEDEADRPGPVRELGAALRQRDHEGRGLAAAGWGLDQRVASGQERGYGLVLDSGGLGDAHLGQRRERWLADSQRLQGSTQNMLFSVSLSWGLIADRNGPPARPGSRNVGDTRGNLGRELVEHSR